ncbi:MAG: hypothetical protein ACI8P9_004697 [Parasphingorhabdus sp.]|jgi:hypothetical protein
MMPSIDLTLGEIVFLVIATLVSSELIFRLSLRKRSIQIGQLLSKILKIVRSRSISDHWKERVLMVYARQLLTFSLQIPSLFLLAMFPLGIGFFAAASSNNVLTLASDSIVLSTITSISILYMVIRSHLNV